MKVFRKWWWVLPLVVIIAGVTFFVWAIDSLKPMDSSLDALESDEWVQVTTDPWYVFRPVEPAYNTGLILYPGGRVEPQAYAPLAHDIASEGFLTVIVPMPLNLAVFDPNRAHDVMQALPEVERWVIGGHSLGGAMAASYADGNRDRVEGLVLMASYPASSNDLSDSDLKCLSIYGTLDGLADVNAIVSARELLPVDTGWLAIEGGNHAQFGWYGDQPGDKPASISREEQQQQTVSAITTLLQEVSLN